MRRRALLTVTAMSLAASRAIGAPPPVVLELFTSQGCSSCPPADALLGELARRPGLIALAWHVDYWNSLGWRDPYARSAWTDRQRAYARSLNTEVYTPALVVNGAEMVVGSDRSRVTRAISQAASSGVSVQLRRTAAGSEAEIAGEVSGATAVLAFYDAEQVTQVKAGENLGRRLVEYRVVRDAVTLPAVTPRMTLPPAPEKLGAVLLIQDKTGRVIGAADLPPPPQTNGP